MTEHVRLADVEGATGAEVLGGDPRVVRLDLSATETVPSHTHPGATVVLATLSGQLAVSIGEEAHDLGPAELLRFDGSRPVELTAVEDALAVVILTGQD